MAGFVVWFTGLSGSGKSTLAAMLSAELRQRGVTVEVLDGDEVRTHLSKGLSFSREDRDINIRRIGFVAKLIARSGGCAMTAAISPYRSIRDEQRAAIGRFVEVYCRATVNELAERDPKGLYKKALAGEIRHFSGIDDPYEPPEHPEVVVDTAKETKEESLATIVQKLEELGYIPRADGRGGKEKGEGRGLPAPHGGDLIHRFVGLDHPQVQRAQAGELPVLELSAGAERDLELLAMGAFSPLKGFVGSKDYLRIVREMRLENGLPWPVPILLPVPKDRAKSLSQGGHAALRAADGRLLGVVEVADCFETQEAPDSVCVGGEILAAGSSSGRDPRGVRSWLRERGACRVVGFAAKGPMLRAEEYLAKCALESADALVIHSGAEPSSPLSAEVAAACNAVLVERYFAEQRTVLASAPSWARGVGPRDALLDALVLKNFGCSHVVIEDARGAASGGGDAACTVFAALASAELGIEPLFFDRAFYSRAASAMGTVKTLPASLSPSAPARDVILEGLRRGEVLGDEVVRPEVANILSLAASPFTRGFPHAR